MEQKKQKDKDASITFRCTDLDRRVAEELARHYGYTLSEVAIEALWDAAGRAKDKTIMALLKERGA